MINIGPFVLFEKRKSDFNIFKLVIMIPIIHFNKVNEYAIINHIQHKISFPTNITYQKEPDISYQFTLTVLGFGFRIIRQWDY